MPEVLAPEVLAPEVLGPAAPVPGTPVPGSWGTLVHVPSHRGLVPVLEHRAGPEAPIGAARCVGTAPPFDAVVVPASRPVGDVLEPAAVAAAAGAHLVVLTSRDAVPAEVTTAARRALPAGRVTVVEIPRGWSLPRLTLSADRLPIAVNRACDTSTKRNAGLALARMRGWNRILFMDDDVRGIGGAQLQAVSDGLAEGTGLGAVGWAFDDFADNSVVCHAHRTAGGFQDTFIGGGALAVRVCGATPHFPRIYNEDWLFMFPLMARRTPAIALAGSLTQDPFDPFGDVQDARRQEFGDVLGEGLFRLLHLGRSIELGKRTSYWRGVLAMRRAFIRRTLSQLWTRPVRDVERVTAALDTALTLALDLDPAALARWVRSWDRDRAAWAGYLRSLPVGVDEATAMLLLGLTVEGRSLASAA